MKKLRVGVVGFGYRGRTMFWLASDCFDFVEPVAVCDVRPQNWYEKQRPFGKPMSEMLPNTKFYENYEDMLKNANLDVVIVETGADIHADFCLKALEASDDEYFEAIDIAREERLQEIIDEVDNILSRQGIYGYEDWVNVLYENGAFDSGITITQLKEILNSNIYDCYNENGDIATNELVRAIIEALGYSFEYDRRCNRQPYGWFTSHKRRLCKTC